MQKVNAIWIGDETKCPPSVYSWIPGFPYFKGSQTQVGDENLKIHGNDVLASHEWKLRRQMKHYANTGEINGVADCMRWELIYELGGTWVDADSELVRNLPDFINELDAIAAWENEIAAPGLIACGFLKFPPKDPFIKEVIDFCEKQDCAGKPAWQTVGPMAITETFKKVKPKYLTILPSHFFFPKHWSGVEWEGKVVYAKQHWGSSNKF